MRTAGLLLAGLGVVAGADPKPEPTDPAPLDRRLSIAAGQGRPELLLMEDVLLVEGFPLLPMGDLAQDGHAWEIHPTAIARLAWDSRPDTGDSDPGLVSTLGAGVQARLHGGGGQELRGEAMLRGQRSMDRVEHTRLGGDAQATASLAGRTTRLFLAGGWRREAEPQTDLPEQVDRQRFEAALGASREAARQRIAVGLSWYRLDYLEDGERTQRDDRDLERFTATAAWSLLGAGNSLLGLATTTEDSRQLADSPVNPYRAATVQGRWRHAFSRRSAGDLRLGATVRDHADDTDGDADNQDRRLIAPAASLRLEWAWEDRSWLVATLSTGLVEGVSPTANAARRHALELWCDYRLRDRLSLVANAFLVRRIDSAPSRGAERLTLDDAFLRLGPDYRLRDGVGVRLWAAQRCSRPSAGEDTDQTLVATELLVAF